MIPVWISLGLIAVILVAAAVHRFPIWNPTYFFGVLFGLQIGAGFLFVRRLEMDAPLAFSVPFLGSYLLCLGLLLWYSLRDRELVVANADLEEQFQGTRLTTEAVRVLTLILVAIALHNTVVNLILIVRWDTLPVIAYNLYRQSFAMATPGVTLPQDVGRPFSVPFFTMVADSLLNPAVVIYLVLLYCPKPEAPAGRRMGFGSVPWWVHAVFGLVVVNGAIVHRRNPLLVGIATAILLLYLLGKLSKRTVLAGCVVLLVGTVAFGQWRRGGTGEFRPAERLELPPVAGNRMVYEPLVYIGTGVPNFLRYWSQDHPPARGEFHLSHLFPRPIDRALGLDVNRTVMLRRMFGDGFTVPGQTFRTPWFESFFEFGWGGVYFLAVLFPTGVHWLYRRALVGPRGGTPSVAFFTLAKIIFLFPFIYLLFQIMFWIPAVTAIVIDWQLARSVRRVPDDPRRLEP